VSPDPTQRHAIGIARGNGINSVDPSTSRRHMGMNMRYGLWSCLIALVLLAGCGAQEAGSMRPDQIPDPTTLARTGWPNDWLICPPGTCRAEPSAAAATYAVPPAQLFAAWHAVIEAQPRVTVVAVDDSRLLLIAQDRTPLLRFVDTISIRVLPTADGGSTFAAYSRSNLGLGDLGTNRRRLEEWLTALGSKLPT
jgi:uncharacterized protein (DUF1499 family)